MKKRMGLSVISLLLILFALPLLASPPGVSKSVLAGDGTEAVVVVRIAATTHDIYGITILDESGSIVDIISPKGWCGIATADRILFGTDDRPIKAGSSKSFRIVTKNKDASLLISFRDKDSSIGKTKTI